MIMKLNGLNGNEDFMQSAKLSAENTFLKQEFESTNNIIIIQYCREIGFWTTEIAK